ncbi:MAG: hypothetical protein COB04_10260 [Gammaproteobacteria bacterium]|nr:MAG: hypothetical protein COB04_10260 [Gammaproteobacteria bacterium]
MSSSNVTGPSGDADASPTPLPLNPPATDEVIASHLHTISRVLTTLSSVCFELVEDVFDVDVDINESNDYKAETFNPLGDTIAYIDFIGSVTGVVAVAADSDVFSALFDLELDSSKTSPINCVESPLKEVMNTVAGKCLGIMTEQYMAVTMLTPKVICGKVSYPIIDCFYKVVSTSVGDISFYYIIDKMKLDLVKALEKLEATEAKTREVLNSLGGLHLRLENAQDHIVSEISETMSKMHEIDEFFSSKDKSTLTVNADACEALANTKDIMTDRLSDTIHSLTVFKNMLMSDLHIRRISEASNHLEVSLSGFIGGDADLSFMHEIDQGRLIINTKNIMNHTNGGVKVWCNHLKRVTKAVDVSFVECSAEFIKMCLEDQSMIANAQIESISAHYQCQDCNYRDEITFSMDRNVLDLKLPEVICNCGQVMELWKGVSQDDIATYLTKLHEMTVGQSSQESDGGQRPH